MKFLNKLLGIETPPPTVVDTKDNDKIKRGSIVRDRKGKYHQVLRVMDGKIFYDDGYGWSTLESIVAHCKTLPLQEVTLVEE